MNDSVKVYTDGSCIKKGSLNAGGWVSIILYNNDEVILQGVEKDTTHNRMELLAIIRAIEYMEEKGIKGQVRVYTDSQYAEQLKGRSSGLSENNFMTSKGKPVQNADLVRKLLELTDRHSVELVKVKAHQKESATENYNRKADKLVRKMVREYIRNNNS